MGSYFSAMLEKLYSKKKTGTMLTKSNGPAKDTISDFNLLSSMPLLESHHISLKLVMLLQ